MTGYISAQICHEQNTVQTSNVTELMILLCSSENVQWLDHNDDSHISHLTQAISVMTV